VENPDE